MSKILLVEDDQEVLSLLKDLLAELPTEIFTADSARSALQIMKEFSIDLVLLDIGLPDLDGFMLFQEIKKCQKNRDTQVIFLTGNIDPEKKIHAFKMGADDYIVKPFSAREFLARVESKLLKMAKKDPSKIIEIGPVTADLENQRISLRQGSRQSVKRLTLIEFKILWLLIGREEEVVNRETIWSEIWGSETNGDLRTVDAHVCALRRKLGPFSHYIESVLGKGYRFSLKAVKRIKRAA